MKIWNWASKMQRRSTRRETIRKVCRNSEQSGIRVWKKHNKHEWTALSALAYTKRRKSESIPSRVFGLCSVSFVLWFLERREWEQRVSLTLNFVCLCLSLWSLALWGSIQVLAQVLGSSFVLFAGAWTRTDDPEGHLPDAGSVSSHFPVKSPERRRVCQCMYILITI